MSSVRPKASIKTTSVTNEQCPIQKIKSDIEALTATHEAMKLINAYYREHRTCHGFPQLQQLDANHLDVCAANNKAMTGPYTPHDLQKTNAAIKKLKIQLSTLQDQQVEE